MPDYSPFLGGPVRILATSPAVNQPPRSQAQALRDIMDRRAAFITAHAKALADAHNRRVYTLGMIRFCQDQGTRISAPLHFARLDRVRADLRAARVLRLSSTMGERLP